MALPNPADESRQDPLAYRARVVCPLVKRCRVERAHHSKEEYQIFSIAMADLRRREVIDGLPEMLENIRRKSPNADFVFLTPGRSPIHPRLRS